MTLKICNWLKCMHSSNSLSSDLLQQNKDQILLLGMYSWKNMNIHVCFPVSNNLLV
jgi:hypothetical protein